MVIEVLARDISADEFLECVDTSVHSFFKREAWESQRGKRIWRIKTPPMSQRPPYAKCNGPFYDITDEKGSGYVCLHIAEIGD